MEKKQEQFDRIKVKRIGIRGDEVAILFFSLVSLAFVLISFFRLFAIGKLLDDFVFLLLFGWSKYLVYLFLFIIIMPICFNYYFCFKVSFVLSVLLTLFASSWLVANITLVINNNNIWLKLSPYQFNDLSNYFQKWWSNSIIKNYHGFFARPFSFSDWTNVNSFFPSFATGGVVANFLITITSYGSFLTNFILNLIILLIAINWLFFSKPWLFFKSVAILFKPITNSFRKKKIEKISNKSNENKTFLDFQEEYDKVRKTNTQEITNNTNETIEKIAEQQVIKKPNSNAKNKAIIIHKVIKQSGNLTPFGKVDKDQTIEVTLEEVTQEND